MHDYIKERTIKIGKYIVETKKTVRVIAKEFGVSKSTVHKDLTERLPEINPDLANEVKEILDYHKSIRHLRGGEATKLKYKKDEILEGEPVQQPQRLTSAGPFFLLRAVSRISAKFCQELISFSSFFLINYDNIYN